MIRFALIGAAFVAVLASPAAADLTEGHVRTIDAATGKMVMADGTVWLVPATIPTDMIGVGDRVLVDYQTAGEDGLIAIEALTLLAPALGVGTDGGA